MVEHELKRHKMALCSITGRDSSIDQTQVKGQAGKSSEIVENSIVSEIDGQHDSELSPDDAVAKDTVSSKNVSSKHKDSRYDREGLACCIELLKSSFTVGESDDIITLTNEDILRTVPLLRKELSGTSVRPFMQYTLSVASRIQHSKSRKRKYEKSDQPANQQLTSKVKKTTLTDEHQKIYSCPICTTKFSVEAAVNNHVEFVHFAVRATGLFKCKCCKKTFRNDMELLEHEEAEHYVKFPFTCCVCQKDAWTPDSMIKHRITHLNKTKKSNKKRW